MNNNYIINSDITNKIIGLIIKFKKFNSLGIL